MIPLKWAGSALAGFLARTPLASFALLSLGLCATAPVHAQLVFTVTATANSTGAGYTAGQSYTFSYVTAASFANNSSSSFGASSAAWSEDDTTHNQMFTAISGTGINGTYVRPVADLYDPYSGFYISQSGSNYQLHISASAESTGSSMGLTKLNGAQAISAYTAITAGAPSFVMPGSYVEPFASGTGFFTSYVGTISSGLTGTVTLSDPSYNNTVFTVTSLTISAVPEPSTYAALAGLAALGFVAWRRRRAAA